MTLYKADFLELHGEAVKSTKKGKKKVVEAVEEPHPTTGGKQMPETPVKKPKTEKQLAALERARENRKRKRDEKEKEENDAIEATKKALADKEAELAAKKAEQKEKRRLKKEAKAKVQEATPSHSTDDVSEAVDIAIAAQEEKPVKIRQPKKAKIVSPEDPPTWFKKYIEGLEMEKNTLSKDKKPVKDIKAVSKIVANHAWSNDLTRDRVNQERDNHMSRMYSSIFGSRL